MRKIAKKPSSTVATAKKRGAPPAPRKARPAKKVEPVAQEPPKQQRRVRLPGEPPITERALEMARRAGAKGITYSEVKEALGLSRGGASGALAMLERYEKVYRTGARRDRSDLYFHHEVERGADLASTTKVMHSLARALAIVDPQNNALKAYRDLTGKK